MIVVKAVKLDVEGISSGYEMTFNELKVGQKASVQKTFTAAVNLNSNTIGVGKGKSKKEAEQQAAREALILMGESVE